MLYSEELECKMSYLLFVAHTTLMSPLKPDKNMKYFLKTPFWIGLAVSRTGSATYISALLVTASIKWAKVIFSETENDSIESLG